MKGTPTHDAAPGQTCGPISRKPLSIMPIRGQSYTREEIAAEFGGGVIEYLPIAGGKIAAACLRLDYNPEAPNVILAGQGEQVQQAAQALCEQGGPIPVFIKREARAWEYVGDYEVEDSSTDPSVIAQHKARAVKLG